MIPAMSFKFRSVTLHQSQVVRDRLMIELQSRNNKKPRAPVASSDGFADSG